MVQVVVPAGAVADALMGGNSSCGVDAGRRYSLQQIAEKKAIGRGGEWKSKRKCE
jgi:hypothetical protein